MIRPELLKDTQTETLSVRVYLDQPTAAQAVARKMSEVIRERQRQGKPAVLGLATGATPVPVYAELIRMNREDGLSFKNVFTFNLDEYYPMHPEATHSYVR